MLSCDTVESAPNVPVHHNRINESILASPERRALHWLVKQTPSWVKPDHLTALGVAGAVLALIGFIGVNFSGLCINLIVLGIFLNWLGDSLDGTLARYRDIQRPLFGYFIDHSCDLISQSLIFVGFGFSPYFTLRSALIALSMYLLMSSYTYLKVMTIRTHYLSYGGVGATEMRVALVAWSLGVSWSRSNPMGRGMMNYSVLDEVVGVLAVIVLLGFVWVVGSDLSNFHQYLEEEGSGGGSVSAAAPPDRLPVIPMERRSDASPENYPRSSS